MKLGKGIFQQIEEAANKPHKLLSSKEFEKTLNQVANRSRKEFKRREKIAKQNLKELAQRSKELNKEVPIELLYILGSTDIYYVGTDFMNKYKEWL